MLCPESKKFSSSVLPLLFVSILVSACTNEMPVNSMDDETPSLVVSVEVHQGGALSQQEQSSLSWSQSLSGDFNTTSKFIKYFETIIPQFQKQVPVSATIRVLKGDKVMYKISFSSESTQEDHPILFVSGVSAFVSRLSETLGLKMEPYASKMSMILREVWVS